jgi:hypothetical protein
MNIPLSAVCLDERERAYVGDAFETGWISSRDHMSRGSNGRLRSAWAAST